MKLRDLQLVCAFLTIVAIGACAGCSYFPHAVLYWGGLEFDEADTMTATSIDRTAAGRNGAFGESHDPDELMIAHPTLPYGTLARATNYDTGRMAIVRVNDRTPPSEDGRIAVSDAAARLLEITGGETASVRVEPIKAQVGVASWYGNVFHGRTTANGETYNQYALTAAHRFLPFGSVVRVTNVQTKQSVVVRINDRGAFIKGRVIDLSRRAAQKIGVYEPGTGLVRIEIIPPKPPNGKRS